ncbi:ATP-binding protein [Vibrio vulnificus]|nr:ATP-binding protein [Vibrio vulnificus]HAS8407909.1 histidine kinase [Vibrio vulnificus]
MKSTSFAFKARARTIDHLGKGQIADAPTAVSELWKNSYDAYARDVALHLFDGKIKCGAIIDNGCGMTFEQLLESWMVIGTESKSRKRKLPEIDRFGLPERFTQGEKGIGRLSTAFLAPVTLLVTKKMNTDYSVALIDWRLFENTYLSLSDIKVPMISVSDLNELVEMFGLLLEDMKENLALEPNPKDTEQLMIRSAWERFSDDELYFFNSDSHNPDSKFVSTEDKIKKFCDGFKFTLAHVKSWQEQLEKVRDLDGGTHGTALFLLDLERDLSLLTNRQDLAIDDEELQAIRKDLVDTLRAFVDPFRRDEIDFQYDISLFDLNGEKRTILSQLDVFSYNDFHALEHRVEGVVDEKGWFRGTVTAFGVEYPNVIIRSSVRFTDGKSKVGMFKFKLGSYEIIQSKSTLDVKSHANAEAASDKYSGILILRDGLRVLPYGRADNDFFELEEKRGKNAGRYFWANRKTFGNISLNQIDNRNLKDKAGREGFIKNQAAREFKLIVIDILLSLADNFFGSKSDIRQEYLSILEREKEEKSTSRKKANRTNLKEFKSYIKNNISTLESQVLLAKNLYESFNTGNVNIQKLDSVYEQLNELESKRNELKVPTKPASLDNFLEESYRGYRDCYSELTEFIRVLKHNVNKTEISINRSAPIDIARKKFNSNQSMLNSQVSRYEGLIENKLENLKISWNKSASEDRGNFHSEAISVLDYVDEDTDLESSLNALDIIYTNLADNFTIKYEAVLRALDRLSQGINLDSAFSLAEEEKAYFEDKANKLQALAQLGISVEVLAHELEQQDMLVTRGLKSLPIDVQSHPGFKTAFEAHKALTNQIRFLSPLKLSGYQARQDITGAMIEKHIKLFFKDRFERQRVNLNITDEFKKISVIDLPSRIYPVFINILNNALYWVSLSEVRNITIDLIDGLVVIANSGPEVDQDDIPRLFELFYSRRNSGHGVGLYLCKENLAVAHHKIWYATNNEEKVIKDGANFIIKFNGLEFL